MTRFWMVLAVSLVCVPAWGSYRAYALWIVHYRGQVPHRAEKVLSTLDPAQYTAFHGLASRARVTLLETWYCPGDTSGRDVCPAPKVGPNRGPASTLEKRGGLPIGRQPVIPR